MCTTLWLLAIPVFTCQSLASAVSPCMLGRSQTATAGTPAALLPLTGAGSEASTASSQQTAVEGLAAMAAGQQSTHES